jgi:hypothetical protein
MTTTTDPTNRRTDPATPSAAAAARTPVPRGRSTMPAGKVMVVILVCLLLWGLLYAPSLRRSSEAQPLGTRRTVSLWVLGPLATISNVLQLTRITDAASSALGKDPDAAPGGVIPPDELPTDPHPGRPRPSKPPIRTDRMRTPTPGNRLRVVVVGDSLAAGLGIYAERVLSPSLTRVSKQGRISTGLSRPDYFNWPAEMQQVMDVFDPDLVIVMSGVNDNQGLESPGGQLETPIGTPQWPPAYEDRVKRFTRIAVNAGAHVVWVGLPIVANKGRWELFQRQNGIFERVASRVPNTAYVDTWDRFATEDGDYSAYFRDDGKVELVRESDGIHFNGTGYDMVARAAVQAAIDQFRLTAKVLQSS